MNEQSCFNCKHTKKSADKFPCCACQRAYMDLWELPETYDDADNDYINEHDPVNHPSHYTQGEIETIDIIQVITDTMDGFRAYCVGNALKYIARHEYKNGVEDLKKAVWYLNRLIEEDEDDD